MTQASDRADAATAMVITRTLNAPREMVWRAWTEAEQLSKWWGPHDQAVPVCRIDLRVGGRFVICMRPADGSEGETWTTGEYKEVEPPHRLVNTISFADNEGNPVPASQIGLDGDWPLEMLVTTTFEEVDGCTTVTMNHVGVPTAMYQEMTKAGWLESLEKLEVLFGA